MNEIKGLNLNDAVNVRTADELFALKKKKKLILVNMTKELAGDLLLNHNKQNRKVQMSRVKLYAKQMLNGEWYQEMIEALAFNENDQLINGQHRLNAIYQTGHEFVFQINFNVPEKCRGKCDTGRARNLSDALYTEGFKTASANLGKAVKFVKNYEDRNGIMWSEGIKKVEEDQVFSFIKKHPGIVNVVEQVAQHKLGTYGSSADLAASLFIIQNVGEAQGIEFVDSFISGQFENEISKEIIEQLYAYLTYNKKKDRTICDGHHKSSITYFAMFYAFKNFCKGTVGPATKMSDPKKFDNIIGREYVNKTFPTLGALK